MSLGRRDFRWKRAAHPVRAGGGRDSLRWCRSSITACSARRGSTRCSRSWCSTSAASATSPRQNQFPVAWTRSEKQQLLERLLPADRMGPLLAARAVQFRHGAGSRKRNMLFGTPAMPEAWLRAIAHHPLAYLQHRAAFLWNFLAGDNLTMWTFDIDRPAKLPLHGRAELRRAGSHRRRAQADAAVARRLLAAALHRGRAPLAGGGAARRRAPLRIGVCGSAAVYVLTFVAVGVASDFRYGYWAVLGGIAGAIACRRPRRRSSAHELRLGQLGEAAAQLVQARRTSPLPPSARLEHQDARRLADGGEPMRDDEGGAVLHHLVERGQHLALRSRRRARWSPRRGSGSADPSAARARSTAAGARRPTASGRARRPWRRSRRGCVR